jgi:putative tricarboxylic transport membrane protein
MAPIALTLVLGPQLETSLGQSLVMSDGSWWVFFRSGISSTLLGAAVISVAYFVYASRRSRRAAELRGSDSET